MFISFCTRGECGFRCHEISFAPVIGMAAGARPIRKKRGLKQKSWSGEWTWFRAFLDLSIRASWSLIVSHGLNGTLRRPHRF